MLVLQKGFNYSQDGPGNRLIYHLQGCNFHCKWCSNPESMPLKNEKAKQMTVQQIVEESVSCQPMFFEGGGVTFTGGECTLQHDELLEVFKGLKENGIHTCIETNGSDPRLDELLPYIDFLIMDLKHPSLKEHLYWTSASNEKTKKNIGKVLDSGRQVLIRIPLIKHVNVQPQLYVDFFSQHNMKNAQIEILSYHEYGKDKWTEEYVMTDAFVSGADVAEMEKAFEENGFQMIHT